MPDVSAVEKVITGGEQLKKVRAPEKIETTPAGSQEFVPVIDYNEVLNRAWQNQALTPGEVKGFLEQSTKRLAVLEALPETVKFSLKEGDEGKNERAEKLRGNLKALGVEGIKVGKEEFTPNEIFEAICWEEKNKRVKELDKEPYLQGASGQRIKNNSEKIYQQLDKQQLRAILALNDGLLAEEIDPMSLTTEKLLKADRSQPVRWHSKQKIEPVADVTIKNPLIIRAKLDRYDVVNGFLNQRAEGRVGQKEPPKPGENQLPGQVNWLEGQKQMIIAGLPYSGDPNHLTVVEVLGVLEDTERMVKENQGQIKGQIQGRSGWIAEAMLRRLEEIWRETTEVFKKDTKAIKTWASEVGKGHLVAEWLEIPDVARILAQKDLYQQRDGLTDKPLEMTSLPEIERKLKEWARANQIPTAKVDLAIFISEILQIGYWTGRVGWKTRHPGEKYGYKDIGAGLPIGGSEFIGLSEEEARALTDEEKTAYALQAASLSALTLGFMTSYSTEHLGKIPDNASEEDLLFISEVGEPAIYEMPDDRLIGAISKLQQIPPDELKQLFQTSYLHREQYRWQFVYGWYSHLYENLQKKVGEEVAERQYLNPDNADHRDLLRRFLQLPISPAATTLRETGISPEWINDEVLVQLFTDENMEMVDVYRKEIWGREGRKVQLSDFKTSMDQVGRLTAGNRDRTAAIALALEFVLRDKRSWGVDLGENNSRLTNGQLAREIRVRGGFGVDEMNVMVTMEYLRNEITNTLSKVQEVMARAHMNGEFYTGKDIVEKLTQTYGDNVKFRAGSMVSPWTALETSASIRSANMLIDYWDNAHYAHTGGRMVTDQETLYDQMDVDRIFYARFHPVVGAAQRVRMERKNKEETGYLDWIGKINKRQRARISAALARFYEREFGKSPGLDRILGYITGDGGKNAYRHCVPETRKYGFMLADNPRDYPDYYLAREERGAEEFYYPATIMQVAGWESQAMQGQIDEDRVKQQIDQMVSFGLMRRWYNDTFDEVGLGDLFRIKFEAYIDPNDKTKGKILKPFPIDFMIDLGQNIRRVAYEYALAKDYDHPEMFWQIEKSKEPKDRGEAWNQFREEMLTRWLVDPGLEDSLIPKTYWMWREMALSILSLTEERIERIPEGGILRSGFNLKERTKSFAGGAVDAILGRDQKKRAVILRPHRLDLIGRLKNDPIPQELARIKELYSDWVVHELTRDLHNAEETGGLFLNEKVQIRKSIEDHYRHGKIDRYTRDLLMNQVIETRYRPNFLKNDRKDPNFWINNSWVSIPGAIWEVTADLLETFKVEVKKYLWFEQGKAILNSSPAGYLTALIANPAWPAIIRTIAAVGEKTVLPAFSIPWFNTSILIPSLTIPLSVGAIWNVIWLIQGPAIFYSNFWRGINWVTRKINKGRGIADGDSLVTIKERVGG